MLSKRNLVLVSVLLVSLAFAEDTPNNRTEFKKNLSQNCDKSYTSTCLKLDLVAWVDNLDKEDDYSVFPGVSLVREKDTDVGRALNTANLIAELSREHPDDPEARLDAFVVKKIARYISTHSLRLNLWNNDEEATGRQGGRKPHRRGGGLGALLAAGAMMKGTLMALAMGGIAAMAGKALMTGLISLLLSAVIGLKSLTQGGSKSTTYEVISKPIYSHANSHSVSHEDHGHYGHSSYGRSFDTPLPLSLQEDYKP